MPVLTIQEYNNLPVNNQNIKVCFDVDGTLITHSDVPRYDIIAIYKSLEKLGCQLYIWSGGGCQYAERWAEKLGLYGTIIRKGSIKPDIAFDDEEVKLGLINIKV